MIFIKFILWFLLSEAIILSVRILLRKCNIKLWLDIVIIVLKLVIGTGLAYLSIAGPTALRLFQPFMMALYVSLFADACAKIAFIVINIIKKEINKTVILSVISFVFGIAFLVFGILNMQTVKPKYLTYTSDKLNNEYKIAFVADLHIGSSQSTETAKNTIRKIKNDNPDFVFLGGDIVDYFTKKEDMESVLSEFKDFDIPVYFVYGNHDSEGYFTEEEFENCLTSNNVIILKDEFVSLSSDLALLGREDLSIDDRKDVDSLTNPYPDKYLIIIDHQPFDFEKQCSLGTDLQLSGHTHAGQLFPLKWIYETSVHAYGKYSYGNSELYVSSGASGWRVPLRAEVGCQYEIIELKPQQ